MNIPPMPQIAVPTKKRKRYAPAITLAELLRMEFPPSSWAVEQLMETGTFNVISAPPNQWKTWILLHTAIEVSRGGLLFNHFVTRQQPVFIVNEEDTEHNMQDRMNKLLTSGNPDELPIHFHLLKGFKIDRETAEDLLAEMKSKNATFLIFDPFSMIHSYKENDATQMNEFFSHLQIFKREGITILLAHHNRKTQNIASNNPAEEMRGSSAISGALGGHLTCEEVINEEGTFAMLKQVKLKCGAKLKKPFLVKVDIQENDKIDLIYAGESEAGMTSQNVLRKKIEGYIYAQNDWVSIDEIIELGHGGETAIREVVRELMKEGGVDAENKKTLESNGVTGLSGASNKLFYAKKGTVDLLSYKNNLLDA